MSSTKNTTALTPPGRRPIHKGMFITKDRSNSDDLVREKDLEALTTQLGEAVDLAKQYKKSFEDQDKIVKELQSRFDSRGNADAETKSLLDDNAAKLADALAKMQACETAIEDVQKQMDTPFHNGGDDLKAKDLENAIELQRRAHIHKGGLEAEFKADMDNLVVAADYRSAARKLMEVGLESKQRIVAGFTEAERKAFEAATLDSAFFSPELLGIETYCEIDCAEMLDLYDQISVGRSTFKYPHVNSYGDIGQYDCDARCDAEYGPEGNIEWRNGQTYDWRGVFCFQRDTLREANYPFLEFMMRAAARSYRINRNKALISGQGKHDPEGWLTKDVFTKVQTPFLNPDHKDLRQFLASIPAEHGAYTATSHQNVFAYFASIVDANGRFIYGDGLMGYGPDDVRERWRISNCLPDPTTGMTKGSDASAFAAGAFILAAGNWKEAFAAVNHRPMFMEQYEGGSTAWCVKYQFGAKDGGFVKCANAARTLVAGGTARPT